MQHWIIDGNSVPPITWHEAMPAAVMLQRGTAIELPAETRGIVWFRLRAGETINAAMDGLVLGPQQRLVVLADEPDEAVVTLALTAGAAGCCNSHAAPDVLRQVALVVEHGGLWVGQSLLQRLVGSTARILGQRAEIAKNDAALAQLSDREAQVARLVAEGASNKEVAEQLTITERTVKAHLTAIFEKLGLRDRLQLSLKINGLTI